MTSYIQQGIVLTFHGDRKDIEFSIAWGKRSGDQMQLKITRVATSTTDDKEVVLSLYVDIFETKRFDFDTWWNTAMEVLQNDKVKENADNKNSL